MNTETSQKTDSAQKLGVATGSAPSKPKAKRETCHECGKRRIPFGFQAFTGRAFCSPECFADYKRCQGL